MDIKEMPLLQWRRTNERAWRDVYSDGSFLVSPGLIIQVRLAPKFIPGYYRLKNSYNKNPRLVWADSESSLSGGLGAWERCIVTKADD